MKPELLTTAQFLAILDDLRARIADGDSLGGSFEYQAAVEPDTYEVAGCYRHGNRTHGQGFIRVVERQSEGPPAYDTGGGIQL